MIEPMLFHHPRGIVFHKNIYPCDDPTEDQSTCITLQIQGDAELVCVEKEKQASQILISVSWKKSGLGA
jgi:hypothetical protein